MFELTRRRTENYNLTVTRSLGRLKNLTKKNVHFLPRAKDFCI